MRAIRRAEQVIGVVAGVLGAVGLALQMVLPISICWDGGYIRFPDGQGICDGTPEGLVFLFLPLGWGSLLAIALTVVGAAGHSRTSSRYSIVLLMLGALVFDLLVILPTPLRILLLPAAVLATLAALASLVTALGRRDAPRPV